MSGDLSEVLSAANAALANNSIDNVDPATRMQLLGVLDQLRGALEPPRMTVVNYSISYYVLTAIRVSQGMGIFDAFSQAQGSKQLTVDELDAKTKGDRALLARLMRYLCANKIFKEVGDAAYEPFPIALDLASVPGDMIKHFYLNMRTSSFLYEYFEKNGYRIPTDAYDAPFQFSQNTKQHFFEFLDAHPEDQAAFNSVMTLTRSVTGVNWHEFFPVAEKLQVSPAESESRALLVDIGGGIGHDISTFKNAFPDLPGRLIVQDLPQAIKDIPPNSLPAGIEAMSYDMFEEQPVVGAKAYYMRTVLHDWPDKQGLDVLARIHAAMSEDSVLLVNENTLSEANIAAIPATLDLVMMQTFSSLDRTEQQWIALLEKAQFQVVKVWRPDVEKASHAIYEAVAKKSG
ncbi:O-methyltransferase [Penicillium angulare]|uniref:O-methyltransferase n=1 Tax=Penicillium angulare TaxID=116970 RepID=A0A9W9K1D0_9EURO|nr:O-methyltransferase [Penicillium angulare]